jgi:hypothetical protein
MAKIKINKLPKGFKLVDGKVVEDKLMQYGGDMHLTGDQADYGLVTTPQEYYGQTMFNNTDDQSVRFSLSSIPREDANIEAEGGETVLTDLNNNGDFGLYNITGPRHSQGGVPMFLPEQSFIYSDTPKLKFSKDEMSEFDMGGSRKTPAQISKKFGLNNYYAELNSQFSDNISSRSAELMLKKNMEDLSKLSFMQEAKKNFEDGVPLASHPFLLSQGLDPLEFTANVEQISMQQAQNNAFEQLPSDQQDQLRMLQQMLAQAEQQQSMPAQNMQAPAIDFANQMDLSQANNDIMPMARFGNEMSDFLNKAQAGTETDANSSNNIYTINGQPVDRAQYIDGVIRNNLHRSFDGTIKSDFIKGLSDAEIKMYGKNLTDIGDYDVFNQGDNTGDLSITEEQFNETYRNINNSKSEEVKRVVEENLQSQNNKSSTTSESFDPLKYFPEGSDTYKDIQKKQSQGFKFSLTDEGKLRYFKPASSKFEGRKGTSQTSAIDIVGSTVEGDPIYSKDEKGTGDVINQSDIGYFDYGMYSEGNIPGTQYSTGNQDGWYGSDAFASKEAEEDWMRRNGRIASKIKGFDYNKGKNDPQWLEFQKLYEEERKKFYNKVGAPYRPYFGTGETGSDLDGKAGAKVFNAPGFDIDFTAAEEGFIDLPKEKEKIKTNDLETTPGPIKEVWRQDQNNLMALAAIQDDLYLPWSPKLDEQKIDYVLDDYTGKVNAIMGAQNTMASALGAAGGPQAIARSNIQGKSLNAIAQAIDTTNRTNLNIMNRAASQQAQMDAQIDMRNKAIDKGLYDDTVFALQEKQNFDNEKIAKNNELFNAMMTNAANSYNLNTLYPYYNVNPQGYGDVEFTENGQQLYKANQVDQQEAFLDAYTKLRKNLPADQKIDAAFLDRYLSLGNSSIPAIGTTKGQVDMQQRGIPGYPGSNVQLKKGKEIKKLPKSFPFFSGKMGV